MDMGIGNSTRLHDNYVVRNVVGFLEVVWSDRISRVALLFLAMMVFLAVFGPHLTPYPYDETQYASDGTILLTSSPSLDHPLGTTDLGYDVLSRLIYGAQSTILTGFLGGTMIITIGMTIGVTAGYVGGAVENVLMRITDFWYAVPLIPFAIVLITLLGVGYYSSIAIIGIILWRGNARVLRSQVLQIKERPFVLAAKASGASKPYIIYKHIVPNIASMAVLFFALGSGSSIVVYASLAFLGVADPFVPSWGIMVRNAYDSGLMAEALWWSIPPGLLISLTVLSMYLIGRRYESVSGQAGDETDMMGSMG